MNHADFRQTADVTVSATSLHCCGGFCFSKDLSKDFIFDS